MSTRMSFRALGGLLIAALVLTISAHGQPSRLKAQAPNAKAHLYGTTRRPKPCDVDLSIPKKGPPSVAQATVIFTCGAEKEGEISADHGILTLADAVTIRIAPAPRKSTAMDAYDYRNGIRGAISMDRAAPVYDAKIGYTETVCHSLPRAERIIPGNQCTAQRFAPNTGLCFRDTFGDWHCRIHPDSWRGAVSVDVPE
jgi:hypothetical protein